MVRGLDRLSAAIPVTYSSRLFADIFRAYQMSAGSSSTAGVNDAWSSLKLAKLGKLLSVDFWRVTPFGGDEYKLNFADGQRKTVVAVDHDGRIVVMLPLVPLSPGE